MEILAAISGSTLITALIWIVIAGVVFFLLNWFIGYAKVSEPVLTPARVIIAIIVVVLIINALLIIIGKPLIKF